MRAITKQAEPAHFSSWKKGNNKATYDDLKPPLKSEVKQSLLEEQYHLCCYCSRAIDPSNSHIDHLYPQCSSPKRQLDYLNFLASCNGGKGKDHHCGHFKGRKILPINPLQADCGTYFEYTANGRIEPIEDAEKSDMASETINTLNLNTRKLINLRKAAIRGSGIFDEISTQEAQTLIQYFETPVGNTLTSCCFVITHLLRKYI